MIKKKGLMVLATGLFIVCVTGIGHALTVHTSDFINDLDRTHFNSFESVTYGSGNVDYTYDGIRVYTVAATGISNYFNDPSLIDGTHAWYHTGGDLGYSVITMADNTDFTNIGFHVGHGWGMTDKYFSYELFDNGISIFSGNQYLTSSYLGFSGTNFDEIRIMASRYLPSYVGDGSTLQALALDAIEVAGVVSSPVPEPATMLLFGLGLLSLASVKRREKKRT